MAINATASTTLDATYDLWAVASLQIGGDGCVGIGQPVPPGQTAPVPTPVSAQAALVKYRLLADGKTHERSPLPSDMARLSIPDVYAFIATGTPEAQAVAVAMQAVLAAVVAVGGAQGVL